MPGLDPGIHHLTKNLFAMDGRVKPGHDDWKLNRHCEKRSDEAIQTVTAVTFPDCFVALAMTKKLLPTTHGSTKTPPARRTCSIPTRAGSAAPGDRRDRARPRAPS